MDVVILVLQLAVHKSAFSYERQRGGLAAGCITGVVDDPLDAQPATTAAAATEMSLFICEPSGGARPGHLYLTARAKTNS